jgi:hypothetical protein
MQQATGKAITIDVYNLKATCNHLCKFLCKSPSYDQFMTELEAVHT